MFFPPPPPAGTTLTVTRSPSSGTTVPQRVSGNQQPVVNDRNVDLPAIEVQAIADDLPHRQARRRLAFNPGRPEGGGE